MENEKGQLLIVDDEPDIAHYIQEMLQDKCYRTKTVLTGEEAIAFMERQPTDLLITDIRMPGMDGLELIKQARESQPDLSCMIITGHGDMDTAVQAVKLGAVDFFLKPIDFTELEKAVGNEMDRLWLMQEIRQQQQEIAVFNKKLGREIRKNQVILHAAGQGIVGLDEQGEITFINPAALEILGWERNELIACTFTELVGRDNAEDILSLPAAPLEADRSFCQSVFKRKDGSIFPVEYVKSLIDERNSQSKIRVFEDITERQAQQEKLALAKIEADEANQAKSHFLARMSHEIRTPMNGILGIGELLLADKLNLRQKQLCKTMLHSGHSLLQLVNDVLDVSKIESGKLELAHEDFDLEQVLERSLEIVVDGAAGKGLGLAYRIESGNDRFLVGDSHKLQQILVNLLANAVKFTAQGEVTVRVKCLEHSADKVMLHFVIQDTGIGIPEEAQGHIFDSFTQADVSTSNRFGGTGLGLTIVHHLAAMMGGEVGLTSNPGSGSTFWFTAAFSRQQMGEKSISQERVPFVDLRILIIGPYPLGRLFLQEQLQEWQVACESTEELTQGVRLLLKADKLNSPYDAVLLDAGANGTAQIELASRIITEKGIPETSLILLTGINETTQDAASIVWTAGITEDLSKPVHLSELYNSLLLLQNPWMAQYLFEKQEGSELKASPCRFAARILLVDDNFTNQLVIGEMLALVGCRPDIASNGHEALTMLAKDGYDLVFMDCQMPAMDGFETTGCIRQAEATTYNRIPIIAMTAKALQGDRKDCLAAGMDDYLSKPFTRDELHQILHLWLPGKATDSQRSAALVEGDELQEEKKNSTPKVDLSILERLRTLQEETGTNMLDELFAYFADDAPRTMDILNRAIKNKEWKSMNEEAHRFKSSCANLGANTMVMICHRLQKFDGGSQEKAMELLRNLQQEYQAVKEILAGEASNGDHRQ